MDIFDRIKSGLLTGTLNRRQAMKALAATGAVATTAPLAMGGTAQAASDEHPMFFTWSGYDDENLYPAYKEKHGELFRFTFWGDEEEGITKMLAGFSPDVVFPCNHKINKWYDTGRLDAIDTSRLRYWDDIFPFLKELDGVEQNGEVVWVPMDWGQTSVLYRTDIAPEYVGNESWSILWDEKYKGRVAAFDSLIDAVVVAGLMAEIDNVFDYRDDADLEATRGWTRKLVEQVRFFSNDPTSIEQAMASGEIVASTAWAESLLRLQDQGVPVALMDPKEGAMTWVCGLSIVKGTPYRDKAHDVIDAMLDPRSREYEMVAFGYGSALRTPYETMAPEELAALGHAADPSGILEKGIFRTEIKGEARLQTMFEEVKAGL